MFEKNVTITTIHGTNDTLSLSRDTRPLYIQSRINLIRHEETLLITKNFFFEKKKNVTVNPLSNKKEKRSRPTFMSRVKGSQVFIYYI